MGDVRRRRGGQKAKEKEKGKGEKGMKEKKRKERERGRRKGERKREKRKLTCSSRRRSDGWKSTELVGILHTLVDFHPKGLFVKYRNVAFFLSSAHTEF